MTFGEVALRVLAASVFLLGAAPPSAAQECERKSATGHVEFIGSMPVNLGRHIEYSFSAVQTGAAGEDGECVVTGEIEERLYGPDGVLLRHSHGTVVCVSTQPNDSGGTTAWIGAKIDRTEPGVECTPGTPPEQCITHGVIDVEDNGEGGNGVTDEGSAVTGRTEAGAYAHCATRPERPRGMLVRGNVQIRP